MSIVLYNLTPTLLLFIIKNVGSSGHFMGNILGNQRITERRKIKTCPTQILLIIISEYVWEEC